MIGEMDDTTSPSPHDPHKHVLGNHTTYKINNTHTYTTRPKFGTSDTSKHSIFLYAQRTQTLYSLLYEDDIYMGFITRRLLDESSFKLNISLLIHNHHVVQYLSAVIDNDWWVTLIIGKMIRYLLRTNLRYVCENRKVLKHRKLSILFHSYYPCN